VLITERCLLKWSDMTERTEATDEDDLQWRQHVRESFRLHLPLSDDHAWTAIAREPLALQWDGPDLGKTFPARTAFARAVLVCVIELGPTTLHDWRDAGDSEREQLAEGVALKSQVDGLLRQGERPVTDDERVLTMRSAKSLAMVVLDKLV
jgi:hypothetical protein